jgi:hypothetical protein
MAKFGSPNRENPLTYMMNIVTKSSFKRALKIILLVLGLAFGSQESMATHMAGGDIEYICVGPRRWLIRLTVYRYCDPGAADLCFSFSCPQSMTATPSPTVAGGGLNPNGCTANPSSIPFTVQLVKVEDVGKGNVARCGQQSKNNCSNLGAVAPGPYRPSIERYTFEGELNMNLPSLNAASTCPYWDIGWSYCCRNSTENIQGQPSFWIQATINIFDRSGNPCSNNSPVMKNEPVAIFCAGQEYVFNMGAVDPDRDSLSYQIIKSLQSANTPVNYNSPYSEKYPFPLVSTLPPHSAFPGSPFVVLDTASGDLSLNALNTSTQPIGGDLSVRIFQWNWREEPAGSGIIKPFIVGITMRNLQIYSIPCPGNNPPRFATDPSLPNGNPKYNWTTCAGDQICFTVIAKDTDFKPANNPPIIDSTFISWNFGIVRPANKLSFKPDYNPNATPPEKPREDRWKFCWQTEEGDGSTLPYYFTIQGEDNRCPNPGRVIRAFSIKVLPSPKADILKEDKFCGKWVVRMRKTDIKQTLSFAKLEIAKDPYDPTFSGGAVTQSTGNANPAGSGTGPRVILTDSVQLKLGGIYYIRYTVRSPAIGVDPLGYCEHIYLDSIIVDTAVTAFARDTFVCKYSTVPIEAIAKWGKAPYTYRWFRNTTTGTPVNGPNFQQNRIYTAGDTVQTKYILRVQDLSGCVSLDSMILTIKQLPVPAFIRDSMRICSYDSFTINAGNNGGNIASYTWYKDGSQLSGEQNQTITRNDSGQFVQLMIDTFGCRMYDTLNLFVNLPVVAGAGPDTSICPGETVTLRGTGGYKYQWDRIQGLGLVNIKPKGYGDSVQVAPLATSDYMVTTFWAYPDSSKAYKECKHTDTVRVSAKQRPIITRPDVTHICSSTDTIVMPFMLIGPANQVGGVGKWSYNPAPGAVLETGSFTQLLIDSLGNLPPDTFYLNIANNPGSATRNYWVKYSYRGPVSEGACLREDSAQIRVYALPKVTAGVDVNLCTTNGTYMINTTSGHTSYTPKDQTGTIGVWSQITGGGLTASGSSSPITYSFNPLATGVNLSPQTNVVRYTYKLEYNTGSGKLPCTNTDDMVFTVSKPPKLFIDAPNKTFQVCKNEPEFDIKNKAQARRDPDIPGAAKWLFLPTPGSPNIASALRDSQYMDVRLPVVTGGDPAGTPYKLVFRDILTGCEVRDTVTMIVNALPLVKLTVDTDNDPQFDSICKTSQPVQLNAQPDPLTGGTFTGVATSATGLFTVSDPLVTADQVHMIKYSFTRPSTGCKAEDSSRIFVQQPPSVAVLPVAPKCDYDPVPFQLSATVTPATTPDRYGLLWTTAGTGTFNDATLSNPTYQFTPADAAGRFVTITVTTTNNQACAPATRTVQLDINPRPNADILSDSLEGCVPLTAYLAAKGAGIDGSIYRWFIADMNNAISTDSAFSQRMLSAGTFPVRLVVETPAGCTSQSETQIKVRPIPVASFTSTPPFTTIAKPYFSFDNTSKTDDGNALSYVWNFGPDPTKPGDLKPRIVTDQNPRNIPFAPDTGEIKVQLRAISSYTDEKGRPYECVHDTFGVVRIAPDITVFIPSAFRPVDGGNGVPCADIFGDCNDVFRVYADGFATIEVFVFNRWGQQVFSTNRPETGWNGKVHNKGEVCPQDVYIYQINATSFSGKKYTYSGSITLLR